MRGPNEIMNVHQNLIAKKLLVLSLVLFSAMQGSTELYSGGPGAMIAQLCCASQLAPGARAGMSWEEG